MVSHHIQSPLYTSIIHFTPRLDKSYTALLWSLFGVIPLKELSNRKDQLFTDVIGHSLLGAYLIMAITVMVNMLIAMMSRSFQIVEVKRKEKSENKIENKDVKTKNQSCETHKHTNESTSIPCIPATTCSHPYSPKCTCNLRFDLALSISFF